MTAEPLVDARAEGEACVVTLRRERKLNALSAALEGELDASSGGTRRLVALVGAARAKELVLLRERLTAAEAVAAGIVTEVVPTGAALDRALALAGRLAALPPLAVAVAKHAIDAMPAAPRDAALLIERLGYGMLAQTADAREAGAAFTERRAARFEGR